MHSFGCEQVLQSLTQHDYTCHIWPSEPASVDPQAAQPDAGYTSLSWKDPSSALFCKRWRNAGASSEGSEEAEHGFIPPLSLCYLSCHTVFNQTMPDHACDILYLNHVVRTPLPQASCSRKSFGKSRSWFPYCFKSRVGWGLLMSNQIIYCQLGCVKVILSRVSATISIKGSMINRNINPTLKAAKGATSARWSLASVENKTSKCYYSKTSTSPHSFMETQDTPAKLLTNPSSKQFSHEGCLPHMFQSLW